MNSQQAQQMLNSNQATRALKMSSKDSLQALCARYSIAIVETIDASTVIGSDGLESYLIGRNARNEWVRAIVEDVTPVTAGNVYRNIRMVYA